MNSNLKVFENENFGNVRVVIRDGEPWFVAADVCKALEIGNPSQALTRLDDDEKFTTLISNESAVTGQSSMAFISESGLYSLVLGSRKPESKQFKRWITHEVIPDIRKHGMYATEQTINKMLSDPDTMINLLTEYKQEKQRRIDAEKQIAEQKPLVDFAETVSKSADNILMRSMAKLMCQQNINIGEKRLFALLREHDILMTNNEPYQTYIDRGYFFVKEGSYATPYGTTILNNTTLVTPKGQIWLVGKVREWLEAA